MSDQKNIWDDDSVGPSLNISCMDLGKELKGRGVRNVHPCHE